MQCISDTPIEPPGLKAARDELHDSLSLKFHEFEGKTRSELRDAVREKLGFHLKDEPLDEYLEHQWLKAVATEFERAIPSALPEFAPHVEFKTQSGKIIRIYSYFHSTCHWSDDYFKCFDRALRRDEQNGFTTFAEECVSTETPFNRGRGPAIKATYELRDHLAGRPVFEELRKHLRVLMFPLCWLFSFSGVKNTENPLAQVLKKSKGRGSLDGLVNLPAGALHPREPTYLSVEQYTNPLFGLSARRSAYMAEFLREVKEDKISFICGGSHTSEMLLFLKNPPQDKGLKKLVERDLRRFYDSQIKYKCLPRIEEIATISILFVVELTVVRIAATELIEKISEYLR